MQKEVQPCRAVSFSCGVAMRCRRILKTLGPVIALLPSTLACDKSSKKNSIEPSMYFLVSGTSCKQSYTAFSSRMAGESDFKDAQIGYCPKILASARPIAGRCIVGAVPPADSLDSVEQTIYYGDVKEWDFAAVLQVMKDQCVKDGQNFVASDVPAPPELNRSNDFYSVEKEVYTAGETVRVMAGQGLAPIMFFSTRNLSGSNRLHSRYNDAGKMTELTLDAHVRPGIYEIVTLQQDQSVIFYSSSTGFYDSRDGQRSSLRVLRFKVENSAQVDTTKPVIGDVKLQSTTVKRGEKLMGSLTASDDLSGLPAEISVIRVTGLVSQAQSDYPKIEGDIWTFQVDTAKFLPGKYVLDSISMMDKAGNEETKTVNMEFFVTP
jgi:hypothetical protein